MSSPSAIITQGYGTWGTPSLVLTLGYGPGVGAEGGGSGGGRILGYTGIKQKPKQLPKPEPFQAASVTVRTLYATVAIHRPSASGVVSIAASVSVRRIELIADVRQVVASGGAAAVVGCYEADAAFIRAAIERDEAEVMMVV